jgi:hypothetical protein
LSAAPLAVAAQSTSCRVFNALASCCNLGSCAGTADFGCRRQWGEKNNNAITGKMQEDGRSACKQVPRSAVSNGQASTINVHRTGSAPASMRKFGEYAFLKDSRYARQAKSARAFPPGASARSGGIWTRIALPLPRLG